MDTCSSCTALCCNFCLLDSGLCLTCAPVESNLFAPAESVGTMRDDSSTMETSHCGDPEDWDDWDWPLPVNVSAEVETGNEASLSELEDLPSGFAGMVALGQVPNVDSPAPRFCECRGDAAHRRDFPFGACVRRPQMRCPRCGIHICSDCLDGGCCHSCDGDQTRAFLENQGWPEIDSQEGRAMWWEHMSAGEPEEDLVFYPVPLDPADHIGLPPLPQADEHAILEVD